VSAYLRRVRTVPGKLLALTLGRLALVPIVLLSLETPAVSGLALAAFVALDLYDGVAARGLGADDLTRRALDSIVDRISIWSVYLAVTLLGLLPPILLAALVARDLFCAHWCRRIVLERGVAISADWLYRGLNLALAGWVVAAPLLSGPARASLFAVVLAAAAVVAYDLMRSSRWLLARPAGTTPEVVAAGWLREARERPLALSLSREESIGAT
jgi:phosphatidylglycerophosphate synthase